MSILKQLTTVSEFEDWSAYFHMRRQHHEKSDWYMAALSHTMNAVNGGKTKIADHLLVFEDPKPKLPQGSMAAWCALLGVEM